MDYSEFVTNQIYLPEMYYENLLKKRDKVLQQNNDVVYIKFVGLYETLEKINKYKHLLNPDKIIIVINNDEYENMCAKYKRIGWTDTCFGLDIVVIGDTKQN